MTEFDQVRHRTARAGTLVTTDMGDVEVPYRVYWDNSELPAGTRIDVIATVSDGSGMLRSDLISVSLGDR